ncbi:hypothetical protein, partial [Klebsiella pneumoniae]|uniref:hypothetical protein n=1 Tax=Klebsiella pneumoniae TaxID=573 RepID=UPI0025A17FBE
TKTKYLYDDYSELKKVFNSDISKSIFKYEQSDIELLTGESIKQELQNFYNGGKRYWFRNFLVFTGYLSLIKLSS